MTPHAIRYGIAIAAVLSACDIASTPQAPTSDGGAPFIERSTAASCTLRSVGNAANYAPPWSCGTRVQVVITSVGGSYSQTMSDAVDAARNAWSTVFVTGYNLPQLVTSPSSTQLIVKFDLSLAGHYWCGATALGQVPRVMTIAQSDGNTCSVIDDPSSPPRMVTDLTSVLKHEFSHAVGFIKHLSTSATSGCTAALPTAPAALNSSICDYERQVVWYMYGLRNTDPAIDQPMIHGSVSLNPASARLNSGASQQFAAGVDPAGTPLSWTIQDPIASFTTQSNTGATVQAGQTAGQTSIIAQEAEAPTLVWPSATGTAALTVSNVATVAVTPSPATICTVGTVVLTATARDAAGNIIQTGTANWSSGNLNAATVTVSPTDNRKATVTPVAAGQVTITANVEGINGTGTVTINNCPPLPTPTNCTIQYIPQPNYLKVAWTNADPSASTEVDINANGVWIGPSTQAPGITQYIYVLGTTRGLFYAHVRHVKTGYPSSAYCTTGSTSK